MDRIILHCDMNGFFASVELLDYPELRNVPMAVCGNPDNRHGIILAKNELAKKYKIETAETLWQARKKCPDLQVVPPNHDKYKHYSRLINKIYYRYTDLVEPFSIDESWLDVTGSIKLFGSGREIADSIRETVKKELGLTLSVGVSYNKIFAKMGSDYKKPDATTVITRENYREILWPLSIGEMFFVGQSTAEKLNRQGIFTIGQMASANPAFLQSLLGKAGRQLWEYANGLENSPVTPYDEKRQAKSIGNGITFSRNLTSWDDVVTAVVGISDMVAGRLRKSHMKACGVKVDIKDTGFHVISKQMQMTSPTNLAEDIKKSSIELIKQVWKMEQFVSSSDNPTGFHKTVRPIRMLTITGINLCDESASQQLSFFDEPVEDKEKEETIERTMDSIRSKFGNSSIQFAKLVDNDIGISKNGPKDD